MTPNLHHARNTSFSAHRLTCINHNVHCCFVQLYGSQNASRLSSSLALATQPATTTAAAAAAGVC
jgi:hypothetical protein